MGEAIGAVTPPAGHAKEFAMRKITTRATHGLWIAAVLTLAGCPLFEQFTAPRPQLRIIPAAFEFTDALTVDSFTITNGGSGILTWEIESAPDWLVITSPTSGAISNRQSSRVILETDTEDLEDGIFSGFVVVNSNGGRISIPVVIGVGAVTIDPSIRVSPAALDFGATATTRTLEVSNGGLQGSFTFTATGDEPWIDDINPATGTVSTNTVALTVTVSRAGLDDGEFTGSITISAPGLEDVVVPVSMVVDTDSPQLSVTPESLDFGIQANTRTATVRNTGSGELSWEVIEDLPWLEVTPMAGETTTESDALTVRVNRAGQPAGLLQGSFLVRASDGQEVSVSVVAEVRDATLVVTPTSLNYGSAQTTKLISISNGGVGTVNWSVDPASLPSWLTLSALSGSVSTDPATVVVTVDRTGIPSSFAGTTFQVTSNAGSATISIQASVEQPVLTITSGLTNSQGQPATTQAGVPIVDLGTNLNTATFTVANTGTGVLNWEINTNQFQPWFALSPVQGSLTEGQSQTVTVTVTREGSFGGNSATLSVVSNAGARQVIIARSISKKAALGVEPATIGLSTTETTANFLVANMGDSGTTVEYEIVSDREWLFASLDTGVSRGTDTPPPFKDYRQHNIFVDRSRLAGGSSVGTLTIRATSVDTAQDPADVPIATLEVTVEAAPLSFEQALHRGRIPSIVRFVFTMRDIFYETITTPIEDITASAFRILEEGVPLDLNETNLFLTDVYDANIVLTLDYSGSMQAAASRILNTSNPLQDIYEATIPDFLNQLPPRYKVSLLAFFDRNQDSRVQSGFTRDRAQTIADLEGLRDSIGQFGATELIPAMSESALLLVEEAGFAVPFDDPDVRAVIVISDGRGTTPPGEVTEFVDSVEFTRARFFNIVWGLNQDFGVPGFVANETGGHFYFTENSLNAEGLEAPSLDALGERLAEIAFDLQNQYLLTYVTLNESATAAVRVTAAFDPPEDDGTPENQGVIQGSFDQDIEPLLFRGDSRLGQISMRSTGVTPGGTAEVIIQADYIPRGIDAFEFNIMASSPFFVEQVLAQDGGLIADWSLSQVGNTFTLLSPGDALPYGSFGPMLRLVFNSVPGGALDVNLGVNNALYASPPNNPRFFTFPSLLQVMTNQDALASAFPTLEIDVDPSTPGIIETPLRVDIPAGDDTATILVRNSGGVHLPTGVLLNWDIASTPDFVLSATGPNGLNFGTLSASGASALITIRVDRTGFPGEYEGVMNIGYNTGSLGYAGFGSVTIATEVLPPELAVDTPGPGNSIDFGAALDSATIVVSNEGQGTLAWSVDTSGLPGWITVNPDSGSAGPGVAQAVNVTVDRTGLSSGLFSTSFPVSGFGQTETVSVQMIVP
jgi:hypothetical protein